MTTPRDGQLMPSHEVHCQDSLRKYGKRFDELHSWMDEPGQLLGRNHRMYRHDPKATPKEAKTLFGEFADHACLDHIRLDEQTSDEIRQRAMDTNFCAYWEGDESSKHCRTCAKEGDACYELWRRVRDLASKRVVFTNNILGKAFGNRYRIELPRGRFLLRSKVCYLNMLQGSMSRFALPIEDFLYVTRTGRGGVNETPSKTRQYPFVNLLLEIITAEPGGADLINEVRTSIPRKDEVDAGGPWDDLIDASFLGPAEDWEEEIHRTTTKKNVSNNQPMPKLQQTDKKEAGKCPRCGSPLVWRRATRTGERYRGCTNYPECKYNERSY